MFVVWWATPCTPQFSLLPPLCCCLLLQGAAALGAEDRAGLLKMMPARYWGVWAADFSCYLTRCLLFWLKLKQKGPAKPSAATAAACDAFTAQQNASTDCLPCIRLLSGAAACGLGLVQCLAACSVLLLLFLPSQCVCVCCVRDACLPWLQLCCRTVLPSAWHGLRCITGLAVLSFNPALLLLLAAFHQPPSIPPPWLPPLADAEFYRSFSRLVNATNQVRVLCVCALCV